MYHNLKGMLREASEQEIKLSEVVLREEMRISERSREEIMEGLEQRYQVMERSAAKALEKPLETVGGLISGITKPQFCYAREASSICGSFINLVMARALSCSEVNASYGRICAAPTAGACGILPAVLVSMAEQEQLHREEVLKGLLTASGIGAVIMRNATVSGAEGGCQAECGVAAAMAAAAAVELKGGSPEAVLHSTAIVLMNCMGLVCDPVAGLVQVPCAQRNASQAVSALIAADMVLAGMRSPIPPDEVIDAMYRVGKQLPGALKETAQGGIAATPTGKIIAQNIYGEEKQ